MPFRLRIALPIAAVLTLSLCSLSLAETRALPGGGVLTIGEDTSRVVYARGEETLSIYRGGPEGRLLLTDGRRDLIAETLERAERKQPLPTILAPAKATYWLEKPAEFWQGFKTSRFHDYAQQTTKVPAAPLPVARWLKDGDLVTLEDLTFRVLETPGYTRSGVAYLLETEGKKVAFTGDLIYGDGRIRDLYSFQDAIPTAQIRGYHGYGARLAQLVESLDRLAAANLDIIVPARGLPMEEPSKAIAKLKQRVQDLYANYLSTNALHWYFKAERMTACGHRVLGAKAEVELMPYCEHQDTPDWIYENSTSRLLISKSGNGFLLDCGSQRVIDGIRELQKQGVLNKVEGIFVTHYHDDHTDQVQAAANTFNCPVYAVEEYADVLEQPDAYHLPAMTANPIRVTTLASGHKMRWREFNLTFFFFPGQTYYHGAMLAAKPDAEPVLFVGDAFAPSGLDDYCVLNRNLLGEDQGFLRCLKQLDAAPQTWLINEHIRHVFRFSKEELNYLNRRYRERISLQSELFTMDAANYGVDEQWAFFRPYASHVAPNAKQDLQVRVWNHSPIARTFEIAAKPHNGAKVFTGPQQLRLAPNQQAAVTFTVQAPQERPDNQVALITADVVLKSVNGSQRFRQWAEAMLIIDR